jgi:hypothetical protein
MAFLGLTRQRTANRREVTVLITELAKIDKFLWRKPIEERKALVAAMRISCKVPDNLGDLDSQTIKLIARGDGRKTADAFADAARWVIDANQFVSTVTEARLDSCNTDSPSVHLYKDLEGITNITNEFMVETCSAKECQEIFDETFKRSMPALVHTFLTAVYNKLECKIQGGQGRSEGSDCHWGKTFPAQYATLLEFKKKGLAQSQNQKLADILWSAIEKASKDVGAFVNGKPVSIVLISKFHIFIPDFLYH